MMQEHESPPSPLEHEEKEQDSPVSSPPHKIARACLISSDETELVTMAAPSPLMLGLGLGLRLGRGLEASSKPAFTFMQLQELEHQALIFKYMAAGLPVPVHLVLPIWKSVAASSFGTYHYPSLMGYGSMFLDYRNSMEPEPGRCRRTDGKKWRCSRDVVPDQKYCDRHMHRGRNRSRKPVEAGAAEPGSGPTSFAAGSGEGSNNIQLSIGTPAGGRRLLSAGVAAARSSGVSACENV